MFGWLSQLWALPWGCAIGILSLAGAVLLMGHQQRLHAKERRRDRRIREEFEAYARLDAHLHGDDLRGLARRVCRLVATRSAFQRVAMLALDAGGRMQVAGSVGMEEITIQALQAWGESVRKEDGGDAAGREDAGAGIGTGTHVGTKSFAVVLGQESAEAMCGRAIMIPLWTTGGQMVGTLVVCADQLMTLRRQTVEEAISPLEALALKLGRELENAALVARLQEIEGMAGHGIVASDVAHALSKPLTAVLGFAELIAETGKEARVRADAGTIVQEARRMRETVDSLLHFGLPGSEIDEPVEIGALVRELATGCEEKLASRGIRLIVQAEDDLPSLRGNGDGLRQMLEHLLNNAAQAIAASASDDGEREHEIRVSMNRDARSLQVIVSDSGTGFKNPRRMFDPLRMAGQAGEGGGLGLGICYAIVREHGGEINAFNLHPYGAAVVMELPLGEVLERNLSGAVRSVA